MVPGELGVQVFQNDEAMPVTAQRAAPLRVVTSLVVSERGRRGGLGAGARLVVGLWSCDGTCRPDVYAGYAPAGSLR